MRTVSIFCSNSVVALACGAPGHCMSATLPVGRALDRLAELFEAYTPERTLLGGRAGAHASANIAAVEAWLRERGHSFTRTSSGDVAGVADALNMGIIDLGIVDGPALFENCRPGEDMALAALELDHRRRVEAGRAQS